MTVSPKMSNCCFNNSFHEDLAGLRPTTSTTNGQTVESGPRSAVGQTNSVVCVFDNTRACTHACPRSIGVKGQ